MLNFMVEMFKIYFKGKHKTSRQHNSIGEKNMYICVGKGIEDCTQRDTKIEIETEKQISLGNKIIIFIFFMLFYTLKFFLIFLTT